VNNQVMRRLEALEGSMGTADDGPRLRIQLWFVSPETGKATAGPLIEVPPRRAQEREG
jgi:hypothetical protein